MTFTEHTRTHRCVCPSPSNTMKSIYNVVRHVHCSRIMTHSLTRPEIHLQSKFISLLRIYPNQGSKGSKNVLYWLSSVAEYCNIDIHQCSSYTRDYILYWNAAQYEPLTHCRWRWQSACNHNGEVVKVRRVALSSELKGHCSLLHKSFLFHSQQPLAINSRDSLCAVHPPINLHKS